MQTDLIITNVHLATMDPTRAEPYGTVERGAVAIKGGQIDWVGPAADCPLKAWETLDGEGGWMTPGLIDCHTHLIYGGSRAAEWEMRLEGASYADIARSGGGILSTVKATRKASHEELLARAQKRLDRLMAEGITTIEIKSGYGLDLESERKMLEVARRLGESNPVTVKKTFLGAHTVPPEFKHNAHGYIDLIVHEMLPALAEESLVDSVDVFYETMGFTRKQCERVFACATQLDLPVKGHVEQFSHQAGARLVAVYDGLSVDHLEHLAVADIPLIKERNVTPVLLPGAWHFISETVKPPIQALRDADVPMALATDLNPGSSPYCSLLLIMHMACMYFGFTPEEALAGVTRNGARALGLGSDRGMLRAGLDADMVLWPVDHPAELSYGMNLVMPSRIWSAGV